MPPRLDIDASSEASTDAQEQEGAVLLLTCPNCGPRNVSEFHFGNEYNPRPADPAAASEAEWVDYLHLRNNKVGVQKEWWHHGTGCGLWFLAERHTKTGEVLRTYLWRPDGDAGPDSETGAKP